MKKRLNQIRLRNLERLIAEAGSAAQLARVCNTSSSYLSQLRHQTLGERGTPRSIGDELTEKLERAMGKPQGWMDTLHRTQDSPAKPGGVESYPARQAFLPLISWVQAGHWHDMDRDQALTDETPRFPCPVHCSEDSYILRVRGTSMEPIFHEGDLIFVDPCAPPDHGKYVIVRLDDSNEATFKQLLIEGGRKYLKALNPDWPDRIIEVNVKATICGVIIFKGQML